MLPLRALAVLAFVLSAPAFADDWYQFFDGKFSVSHRGTEIKVGVLNNGGAAGTLLYMPGFADTIDNHEPLLKAFRAQGFQVIAFDYPEHGTSGGDIRWWGLQELAEIIPTVLADKRTGFNKQLPLVLAGWSTGGTISIRLAQSWRDSALPEGVRLAGIVAYAPAIPAQVVVKVDPKKVTDGFMKRGPKPGSVPVLGQFASSITIQSRLGSAKDMPSDVKTLILVGGDDDNYAISSGSISWVKGQGSHVAGFQCVGSMHGFEFQPAFAGEAKTVATQFAAAAIRGNTDSFLERSGVKCPRIRK